MNFDKYQSRRPTSATEWLELHAFVLKQYQLLIGAALQEEDPARWWFDRYEQPSDIASIKSSIRTMRAGILILSGLGHRDYR